MDIAAVTYEGGGANRLDQNAVKLLTLHKTKCKYLNFQYWKNYWNAEVDVNCVAAYLQIQNWSCQH